MSILEDSGHLPSVQEMMEALSSPIIPQAAKIEDEMQMSTEDMIKEMFVMLRNQTYNNSGTQML